MKYFHMVIGIVFIYNLSSFFCFYLSSSCYGSFRYWLYLSVFPHSSKNLKVYFNLQSPYSYLYTYSSPPHTHTWNRKCCYIVIYNSKEFFLVRLSLLYIVISWFCVEFKNNMSLKRFEHPYLVRAIILCEELTKCVFISGMKPKLNF